MGRVKTGRPSQLPSAMFTEPLLPVIRATAIGAQSVKKLHAVTLVMKAIVFAYCAFKIFASSGTLNRAL